MLKPILRILRPTLIAVMLSALIGSPSQASAARAPYRAASPEFGLSVFVYDQPGTTERDLGRVTQLGFGWAKALFRWTDLEHDYKGAFYWTESDRVVRAANTAGLKLIARLDFQPWWARADQARNGPPDSYQDFADFVYAFAARYSAGSPIGQVHAIQVWNEPNLAREWGEQSITRESAADYVRLLSLASRAAKGADPNITVIGASLSPTVTADSTAQPDDVYLRWIYELGGKESFDVLGVNANVQCPCIDAAPASQPGFVHPSFYFRRVEQLRQVMVANGDADKQVWLMEFGWTTDRSNPSYAWYATTEERRAELFVEAIRYARTTWAPWIGVMAVWTVADPSWELTDERHGWAITNADGTTRPAFDRLARARLAGELQPGPAAAQPANQPTLTPSPSPSATTSPVTR